MGIFKKLFGKPMNEFYAPVAGNAVPVSQVPDPTFAEELLGKGIAIEPAEGKVYAPCDATVDISWADGKLTNAVIASDFGGTLRLWDGREFTMTPGQSITVS